MDCHSEIESRRGNRLHLLGVEAWDGGGVWGVGNTAVRKPCYNVLHTECRSLFTSAHEYHIWHWDHVCNLNFLPEFKNGLSQEDIMKRLSDL